MSFNPSSNQNVEDYLLSIVILFVWNIYLTILYMLTLHWTGSGITGFGQGGRFGDIL